jgi:hypothetical protein
VRAACVLSWSLLHTACSQPAGVPDAGADAWRFDNPGPVEVVVSVIFEFGDSSEIWIAGEQTNRYETVVADEVTARETLIEIENVVDGQVVTSLRADADCDVECGNYAWTRTHASYCGYGSGELRWGSQSCSSSSRGCTADGFCDPICLLDGDYLGCPSGQKCGFHRTPASPGHGWLDCVAPGLGTAGSACTVDSDGADDCGERLHCHEGICRRACYPCTQPTCPENEHCTSGEACERVTGASPEVGVCLPDG